MGFQKEPQEGALTPHTVKGQITFLIARSERNKEDILAEITLDQDQEAGATHPAEPHQEAIHLAKAKEVLAKITHRVGQGLHHLVAQVVRRELIQAQEEEDKST